MFIRLSPIWLALALATACGGTSRPAAEASSSGKAESTGDEDEKTVPRRASDDARADAALAGEPAPESANSAPQAASTSARSNADVPPPPLHDPVLVRAAVDATAAAPDERARLGLRLAVVDQGPDTPWLLALVNRGTTSLRVVPDLRTLALEVTAPTPEPDPKMKGRPPRVPKPVTCTLPRGLVPSEEDSTLETQLEPGEGIVDSFDPRLYCLPVGRKSPLVPGANVVVRLGWPEKTKAVWKKGKKMTRVLEQVAPFIARKVVVAGSLPEADQPKNAVEQDEPLNEPQSDARAIKQVVGQALTLGTAYEREKPAVVQGLELILTRGSDAATERDATIAVSLVNHGKKLERVYFRREAVTFEISGPNGLVACDPGPDNRAPDRAGFSSLRPGGRLSATTRLIEMCPQDAMRRPGLYLVHARYDGLKNPDPQAPATFSGRVVSRDPVTIRVRRGWGEMPAQRAPERVRVGTP